MAQRRRWLAAGLASLVAYVMGQAFAYSPIEVYTQDEIMAIVIPGLQPASGSGGVAPAGR